MEMISTLLLLVMPGIFVHSSQAYTCYQCTSSLTSACVSAPSSADTCIGDYCMYGRVEEAGETLVVRSCYTTQDVISSDLSLGCQHASTRYSTASLCVCEWNFCNGGGFSSSNSGSSSGSGSSSSSASEGGGNVRCHYCLSTLTEDCGDPFPDYGDRSTCIGDVCYKAKYENEGRTYVARGCDFVDSYTELGCRHATFADEKASLCYCDTAKCNMAAMTSSFGHVIIVVTLLINAAIARLL